MLARDRALTHEPALTSDCDPSLSVAWSKISAGSLNYTDCATLARQKLLRRWAQRIDRNIRLPDFIMKVRAG